MRSLSLCAAALLLSSTAMADEGVITISLASGAFITDQLEPFDSGITFMPRVQYGLDHGVGIEADISMVRGTTRKGEFDYQGLTPRLNFFASAMPDQKLQPIFIVGPGVFIKTVDDSIADQLPNGFINGDTDFIMNIGSGFLYEISDSLSARSDFRMVQNFGTERFDNHGDVFQNWEWTMALSFSFGGKDTDGDGITDGSDACMDEAEDMDDFEDDDGCPEPDNDLDGVLDADDQCDGELEDLDNFEDEDGCPEPDNDKDGVLDVDDNCPILEGDVTGAGCPDGDGDSVIDSEDECPTDAGLKTTKGCPDSDGDTVVDSDDECVDEKGTVAAWGCPDADEDTVGDHRDECKDEKADEGALSKYSNGCVADVFVVEGQIVVKPGIVFAGEVVAEESKPHLESIAALLAANEDMLLKLKVYSDKGADEDAILQTSKLRAADIRGFFMTKDLPARRLGAKGMGSEGAKEGETNARVEFNYELLLPEVEEAPEAPTPGDTAPEDKGEAPADDKGEAPADEKAADAPATEEAPAADEKAADAPATEAAPAADEKAADAPATEEAPAADKTDEEKAGEAPVEQKTGKAQRNGESGRMEAEETDE